MRRTTCIPRSVVAIRLDTLYSSDERRNSCKYAGKGRKPVAMVAPQNNTRRHIETRSVCPEEATDLGRICNDPPWIRRRFRRMSDKICTGRSRNTGPYCNCCDSRARIGPSCSSSSLRCSWCSLACYRSHSRADMPRIRVASCRRCNPPGTRRDTCLRHICRRSFSGN